MHTAYFASKRIETGDDNKRLPQERRFFLSVPSTHQVLEGSTQGIGKEQLQVHVRTCSVGPSARTGTERMASGTEYLRALSLFVPGYVDPNAGPFYPWGAGDSEAPALKARHERQGCFSIWKAFGDVSSYRVSREYIQKGRRTTRPCVQGRVRALQAVLISISHAFDQKDWENQTIKRRRPPRTTAYGK